MPFEYNHGW